MTFTTPLKQNSIKMMLLGSGELGKEVAIEAMRLGVEVIAVDKYENAPAQMVANRAYTINMKDKCELLELIRKEKPTYILPEVEAISIEALFEAENEGFCVIPNAKAVSLTMNRRGIREFVANEMKVKTSKFLFAKSLEELIEATKKIGFPCVIKPVMSSSGHGQSVCHSIDDVENSFNKAKEARGDASELIVEEFITFDYEITLLTIRNSTDTIFCQPIGHIQKGGDYIYSWQPMKMSKKAIKNAKEIAKKVTDGLGGRGLFGVELFVKGDEVYFSEVSPRPHDTGMVTMITQSLSEFALHVRAILDLPLEFRFLSAGASAAFKSKIDSLEPTFTFPEDAFKANCDIRVFGKPESHEGRRMAVVLVADDEDGLSAKKKAKKIVKKITEQN
ncbi:MAG: formate-dependent phosphoribosylglycinamide formyltransferase [Campylobacterales bacterium]|nr:formate-dependent phosphoribosylglycinamide formyltransferase [Campylobacterales bacterium]